MVFEYSVRVRYADTDRMGVVYYANYLKFFEIGRVELIRNLGYSYVSMEEKGIMLPVLECTCNYVSPARYDDELIIKTRITQFAGVKVEFNYEIVSSEKGVSIVKGKTIHVFTDKNLKPIRLRNTDPGLAMSIENILEE